MIGRAPTTMARAINARPGEIRINVPEFYDDALCLQVDDELFFPTKGGSTKQAKKVCGGCDVREQCLQYALEFGEEHGIWGGTSGRERRKMNTIGDYECRHGCGNGFRSDKGERAHEWRCPSREDLAS